MVNKVVQKLLGIVLLGFGVFHLSEYAQTGNSTLSEDFLGDTTIGIWIVTGLLFLSGFFLLWKSSKK